MSRLAATVLAFLAVAPAPFARAAEPSEAVAVQLSRYVLPEENWNRALEGVTAQLQTALEQRLETRGNAALDAALQAAVAAEMKRFFTYQDVVDMQAGVLAKHYTDDELREMFAFYRTPVGQKAIRVMPEVVQDVNGLVLARLQERLPGMTERLAAVVRQAKQDAADAAAAPAPEKAAPPAKKPAGKAR